MPSRSTTTRLSDQEAYERAQLHAAAARRLRSQSAGLAAEAAWHERWADRWRDWADDDDGDVPYPGDR